MVTRTTKPTTTKATTTTWVFDGRSVEEAFLARDAALAVLANERPLVDGHAARLVLTELLGNVVRHAPTTSELRLDIEGGHVTIHVIDNGKGCESAPAWLPNDPLSEGGRGLFIVRAFSRRFEMRNRGDGGCHMIADL